MSLLPLIRFRNFDAQLTDNEFFNQFIKSVEREENQQEILSYDCIDQLPSELISECASYLNYEQYFRLAKCNRKIYIACNAFPKIQEFDFFAGYSWYVRKAILDRMRDMHLNVSLNAFKNIEKLKMSIKHFNDLPESNKSTWRNNNSLHSLTLYSSEPGNDDDLISFINNQHLINYNNVITLQLQFFRSELIYDILSKFSQIQNLILTDVQFDNNSNLRIPDKNEIQKWFPNVKSLELNGTNRIFAGIIIEALHNQLESLSFDSNVTIPSNIIFAKLQSLIVSGSKIAPYNIRLDNNANFPDKNKIKTWLPNVKSLELYGINRILAGIIIEVLHNQLESLSVYNVVIPSNVTFPKLQSLKLCSPTNVDFLKMSQPLKCVTLESYSEDIINTFIENTICKQLALENVKIKSRKVNSFSILQKLESSLAINRNIKRKCKRLCIELIFGEDSCNDDKKEFGLQIFRVSNVLKASNIDNWCLKIEHADIDNNFDKEYFENESNEMKRNYFVDCQINHRKLMIVISNSKEMC